MVFDWPEVTSRHASQLAALIPTVVSASMAVAILSILALVFDGHSMKNFAASIIYSFTDVDKTWYHRTLFFSEPIKLIAPYNRSRDESRNFCAEI